MKQGETVNERHGLENKGGIFTVMEIGKKKRQLVHVISCLVVVTERQAKGIIQVRNDRELVRYN